MMSAKRFADYALIALVVCGGSIHVARARAQAASPSLIVNNSAQVVQVPTLATSGISYQTTGQGSALTVFTDGFLFCANVTPPALQQVSFTPAHEDQSLTPNPHPWVFGTVYDVQSVNYLGGMLNVNRTAAGPLLTTLTCHGTDAAGAVPSGLTDGIFDNRFETKAVTNYTHQVNWVPQGAFDWNMPDWTQVPVDGCDTAAPQVLENVACAAVSGYSPATTSGVTVPAARSALMWTAFDPSGLKFTYLFRFDGRAVPPLAAATVQLNEAFDGGSVGLVDGFLAPNGAQYCFLTQPPSTLDSSVCTGNVPFSLNGPLSKTIVLAPPPSGAGVTQSYYVAVTRMVLGGHQSLTTPVVAVSVSMDPAVVAEGGDKFSGDDVVFGFMPTSTGFRAAGFDWMSRQ